MVIAITSNAQDKKWDLSISGGLSQPIGSYASTDIKSNSSGFAKTGYNLGVDVSRLFTKNIGAFVHIGYARNGIDTGTYKNRSINGASIGRSMKYATWDLLNVGVGPVVNFNVSENFKIFVKPEIGLCTCFTPTITESSGGGTSGSVTEQNTTVNSLYFSIAAGLKFSLSNRISLNIIGYYFVSECDFNTSGKYTYDGVIHGQSYSTSYTYTPVHYTNQISTISLNAGLSFAF